MDDNNKLSIEELEDILDKGNDIEILPSGEIKEFVKVSYDDLLDCWRSGVEYGKAIQANDTTSELNTPDFNTWLHNSFSDRIGSSDIKQRLQI